MTPDARGRIHRTLVSAIPSYEYAQVRSPYLWINYYQHGRPVRESTGTKNEVVARRMLRTCEGDVERGIPIDPKVGRITFHDVREDMLDDYKANRKKTYVDAKRRIDEHLAPFFGNRRGGSRAADFGLRVLPGVAAGSRSRRMRRQHPARLPPDGHPEHGPGADLRTRGHEIERPQDPQRL